MKICFVTPEFVTENKRGGQATYLENISKILSEHGHEIIIVVISDHEEVFEWKKGITVYRVKYKEAVDLKEVNKFNIVKKIYNLVWAYSGISFVLNRKVKKLYKRENIEIVQYSSLRAIPLFMSKKIPSVIRLSAHPIYCRYALEEFFDLNEAENNPSFSERLWLLSLKKADHIFGPSQIVGQAIEREIGERVDIIESPLRVGLDKMDADIYNNFLVGKKYWLFFGTLNYLKGIQVVAPILDDFLEKYQDIYFVFLGKNDIVSYKGRKISAKEYLFTHIKRYMDRVIFIDPIYDQEKIGYIIYKSEACVMPSRMDNLPNTCIESMALGKIVVGTKGASFEQLISDGENGYLCERDNPESLYACMNKVMEMTEEQRQKMGMRAKKRTEEMSGEKIYAQLMNLYEKVLNN